MKYFVLGALASGILLYGMSMIYGATGTLQIDLVAHSLAGTGDNRVLLIFGLVFVVSAIAFKLGAVPYHMWVPDVYQGAPTPVTFHTSNWTSTLLRVACEQGQVFHYASLTSGASSRRRG